MVPKLFDRTWNPTADPSAPLRWRKPGRVLVEGDLFREGMDIKAIDRMYAVMTIARETTFVVPTERPDLMWDYFDKWYTRHRVAIVASQFTGKRGERWGSKCDMEVCNTPCPLPNIIPACLVRNQADADERIPHLLRVPCRVPTLHIREMRGPIDLSRWLTAPTEFNVLDAAAGRPSWHPCPRLGWVIVEGGDDPLHPSHVRSIRDQCRAAGVPFAFLGWGEWCPYIREDDDAHLVGQDGCRVPLAPIHTAIVDRKPRDGWWWPKWGPIYRRVGRVRSIRTLDGREHTETPNLSTEG